MDVVCCGALVRRKVNVPRAAPPCLVLTLLAAAVCKAVLDSVPFSIFAVQICAGAVAALTFVRGGAGGRSVRRILARTFATGIRRESQ